jgi:hypothetical protein
MTTINLKRYYPYMTESMTMEVSDEIAAILSIYPDGMNPFFGLLSAKIVGEPKMENPARKRRL